MTVDISGGRQVFNVWQFDDEFRSMYAHVFADDDRGSEELRMRLRGHVQHGRMRIVFARTHSGANRMCYTECTACKQFNYVQYGTYECQKPESRAERRKQFFSWHWPPIESAPPIGRNGLPGGMPTV